MRAGVRYIGMVLAFLVVQVASEAFPQQDQPVEPFYLVDNGKPQCAIVIPKNNCEECRQLAEELAKWLNQMTDASFPITTTQSGKDLIIGTLTDWPTLFPKELSQQLGPEGYAIRTASDRMCIVANTHLGLQHGIYGFLQQLGCRWYFPDPVWTVIPQKRDIVAQLDIRSKPAFQYRRIWYGWGPRTPKLAEDYREWLKHNRLLGSFRIDCGHAYERYIPRRLFEQHPEWFSLVDGQRQPRQLCTSNPEVQQYVIEQVLRLFRKDPDRIMASLEPNDGDGYCECQRCIKLGSPSDRVFHLANVVARALRQEFPDKWVGLLAYAGHSDPPNFRLEPNIHVQVTTGFRYTKLSFDEQVQAFRRLGAAVGVYDYFSVYPWDWDLPGAAKAGRVYELAQAIKHYHELGLITYDAESSCNWGPNGLGYWMAAQLMWNPELDPETLVNDFCCNAFGKAAPAVKRIYMRWSRGERFSARNLKPALLNLQEAYQLADQPDVRTRLDRLAMYLHWLRLWLDYSRHSKWNQWGKLAEKPETVRAKAAACVRYARRIMDTGLIHSYPMLETTWFKRRFAALEKIPGFDWQETDAWKTDKTIPASEQVARDFASDLAALASLTAVEIEGRPFTGPLVSIAQKRPDLVRNWSNVKEILPCLETGLLFFPATQGETMHIEYVPFGRGHTIDCNWVLYRVSDQLNLTAVASGRLKQESSPATLSLQIPASGIYALDPGTGYWHAARIKMDDRPVSIWAPRANPTAKVPRPMRLWLPRLNEPLYFYVPKGTKHFVIGVVSGGDPYTRLRLSTSSGDVVLDQTLVAGDQISVLVESDVEQYGNQSAMGQHAVLPATDVAVPVAKKADGQIWRLELDSLRCVIELYDVPPFLAASPAKLLVPANALTDAQ